MYCKAGMWIIVQKSKTKSRFSYSSSMVASKVIILCSVFSDALAVVCKQCSSMQ